MKFQNTFCSQCGGEFGPGDHGYSHCRNHQRFANHLGYSDIDPFEVVKVVSDKTLEIREMVAERDESVKLDWAMGGFAGHCINQRDQKWHITSDETAPVIRIRWGKHGWQDAHGRSFRLSHKPSKFYDYNF